MATLFSSSFSGKFYVRAGLAAGVLLLAACGGGDNNAPPKDDDAASGTQGSTTTPPVEEPVAQALPEKLEPSIDIPADDPAIADFPKVTIATTVGDITVVLYREQAPVSVENFLGYVNSRQYTRTIFHRVIQGFMIQGGGFSIYLEQRQTRDPIAYEGDNGLSNERGTLAMARTNSPDSATAQWYINHEDNANLDHGARGPNVPGYTVFGRVISGMNIVDAIASVETSTQLSGAGQELRNVPVTPIVIENVQVVE